MNYTFVDARRACNAIRSLSQTRYFLPVSIAHSFLSRLLNNARAHSRTLTRFHFLSSLLKFAVALPFAHCSGNNSNSTSWLASLDYSPILLAAFTSSIQNIWHFHFTISNQTCEKICYLLTIFTMPRHWAACIFIFIFLWFLFSDQEFYSWTNEYSISAFVFVCVCKCWDKPAE